MLSSSRGSYEIARGWPAKGASQAILRVEQQRREYFVLELAELYPKEVAHRQRRGEDGAATNAPAERGLIDFDYRWVPAAAYVLPNLP